MVPGLERRLEDKGGSGVKVKEERPREEELMAVEREKMLQNSYLGLTSHHLPPHAAPPHLGLGLLDRGRMVPPHHYLPGLEPRPPGPSPVLWNPFDKASELNHRFEMERVERERMAMFSRLTGPMALMEQERIKEHMIREHHEREMELRRQYLERLPPYERERLTLEKLRSDSLVAAAAASTLSPFSRTISPMFNHHLTASSKNGSPATLPPGIPPPLIPSASATASSGAGPSRSHDNSPSSTKTKGYSIADSTSDLKDKREGVSADPDPHAVR